MRVIPFLLRKFFARKKWLRLDYSHVDNAQFLFPWLYD